MKVFSSNERALSILLFLLWSAISALNLNAQEGTDKSALRPVTVLDSIRMRRATDWVPARFSPDGKRFVVVLETGNPIRNTNEYTLLLWKTSDVFQSSAPEVLLTMPSSSNRAAIDNPTWLADNRTITFLGERPGELHQLYAFDVVNRSLRRLTRYPTNLRGYAINTSGSEIAFVAEAPSRSIWNAHTVRYGFTVSTQPLSDLMRGMAEGDQHCELLVSRLGLPAHRVSTQGGMRCDLIGQPSLSPDGKHVVIATQVIKFPEKWKEYADPDLQRESSARRGHGVTGFINRFELITTTTGESRFLMDSPTGTYGSEAVWLPNNVSLVVTRTYLPLGDVDESERSSRRSHTSTVEVNIVTGAITTIAQEDLYGAEWDAKRKCLMSHSIRLESNTEFGLGQRICFRRKGVSWQPVQNALSGASTPNITLEEGMNAPPRIFAIEEGTHRKSLIFDLNPQFRHLKFAKVEEIHWNASDGHEVKGGLYYPVNYRPGQKYPLVIQTHGWSRTRFLIDGPVSTGYAAQALAGQNMLVLQSDDSNLSSHDTPDEAARELASYEGAIEYLDDKGMVDRSHVGIMGFSRSCYFLKFALTHAAQTFAAASLSDGIDAGYFQYIAFSSSNPVVAEESEKLNGGAPWGPGLEQWSHRAPSFGVDRVETPLRIFALNPGSLLGEWEWFAALSRLDKPVDLIYLQNGVHQLVKPWERELSQQGNVDWFKFWLKDEEDPDPEKAEQYVRWRELRDMVRRRN